MFAFDYDTRNKTVSSLVTNPMPDFRPDATGLLLREKKTK